MYEVPEVNFVYVVSTVGGGQPWKIGTTTQPMVRLKTLRSHSPAPLEFVKVVEAHPSLEKSLHRQFGAYRTNGEWFTLPPEQADLVLARLDGAPWQSPVGYPKRKKWKEGKANATEAKMMRRLKKTNGGVGFRLDSPEPKCVDCGALSLCSRHARLARRKSQSLDGH